MASFGQILAGKVGKVLSAVPIAPVKSLGNSLQSYGGNTSGQGFVYVPASSNAQTSAPRASVPSGIGVATYSGGGGGYAPASGGQAAAPVGGGNAFSPDQDYLNQLRSAFNGVKDSYNNQLSSYDSDYNNQKTATDAAVTRAKDTFGQQNQNDEQLYGQNLKNLAQTDQELRQRRQGTYSALGSLDSSSFQQDTAKADQSLIDNQQSLGKAKDQAYHDRETQLNAYVDKANTDLNSYANEIARAKEGLKSAIANVDLNQAQAIQSYIGGLQQQAQQVAQQQQAMAANLAQLQAQGVDVVGNLQKTNLSPFTQQFGQNLQSALSAGTSRYQVPAGTVGGAGYIGGNSSQNDIRKLLGL